MARVRFAPAKRPHTRRRETTESGKAHAEAERSCARQLRTSALKLHAVVETEAQLRHAAEERLHLDGADNLGAQYRAVGVDL